MERSQSRKDILDRGRLRASELKALSAREKEEQALINTEKIAFAQIDWHDFILVETITFDESDNATDLPVPLELSTILNLSLEMKMGSFTAGLNIENSIVQEILPDETGSKHSKRSKLTEAHTICPNCSKPILITELEAHMKIELLNSNWKSL